MSYFPQCKPIVPYLRNRGDGIAIERVLQELQDEAADYPERYKQLAAVRYYLHYMLWECEYRWNREVAQGVTNQVTLLDQLERWRTAYGQEVCLVTFNYDTMLEAALSTVGIETRSLSDYVASDRYKLVKLHGSVNWAREVDVSIENLDDTNVWQVAYELIDRADEISARQRYHIVTEHPIGKLEGAAALPAVVIPLETKSDFECPPEHLEVLRAAIPKVDKLLVIGWRAAETPFLELLAQNLQRPIWGLVVAENSEAASETADKLKTAGAVGDYIVSRGRLHRLRR